MAAGPFSLTINGVDYLGAFVGGSATTPYVLPETVSLSKDGDGGGSTLSFEVAQEVTPAGTPWYVSIPDNAVVKFADSSLASDTTLFAGFLANVDATSNGGGQGTIAQVTCNSSVSILDKIVVYKGKGTLGGIKGATTSTIKFAKNKTDKAILTALLATYVNPRLGAKVSELFDASSVASITSTCTIAEEVSITIGTLRSAIETVKELAEATDGIARRYYIDTRTKRLVYGKAPASAAYADAPFKIVTAATDSPAGGTATASTLNPRSLSVQYDHEQTVKNVVLVTADSSADADTDGDPYVRTYTGVGYAARTDALVLSAVVDVATVSGKNKTTKLTNTAKAYYSERYKPRQSITFEVRGAGTASGQTYGYGAGTAQIGTATWSRVDRWDVGQFVDISATHLGLSGLYRIESVEQSFEQGSLVRRWAITCQTRPIGKLSQMKIGG